MRISDWSSDVCSSDLARRWTGTRLERDDALREAVLDRLAQGWSPEQVAGRLARDVGHKVISHETIYRFVHAQLKRSNDRRWRFYLPRAKYKRSEEHTSELQSLMRISYAVFCLKKKKRNTTQHESLNRIHIHITS